MASRWLDKLRLRARSLFRSTRIDAEIDAELEFFVEQETDRHIRTGMTRAEAREAARQSVGSMHRVKDRCREARGLHVLSGLGQDVRLAIRSLRRNPGFTFAAVTVLAVGIGASTAIFSAVNAFLFRPLPFTNSERLVMLFETNPEFDWTHAQVAPANALDWREQVEPFDDLAIYADFMVDIDFIQDGQPSLLGASQVTGNFFSVLGARPLLGRTFSWEETWDGRGDVVVLNHATWVTRFAGDPNVIGRRVPLGSRTVEIIGVMPAGFGFPRDDTDIWTPFGWQPEFREQVWFRRAHSSRAIARLAPGVSRPEANAAFQGIVERLQQDFPETNRVMGAGLMPVRDYFVRDVRRPLYVLLGAVALLLIIACSNVANLMLIRAADRTRDVALRFALGAARYRVIRQTLVDGILLALAGGGIGLALGWVGIRALAARQPVGIDGATALTLDSRVVLFTLLVALGSALLFAAAPALSAGRVDVSDALATAGRGQSIGRRARRSATWLVAGEIALTLLLVVGAGLMVRTFLLLRNVDPGFRTDSVLGIQLTIPPTRYSDRDSVLAFQAEFERRLEARRGIERAGLVARLPLTGRSWSSQFQAQGWPADRVGNEIIHRRADRGYFEALSIPLLRGRLFGPQDRAGSPRAVLVNETFARTYFPNDDPIGQRIAYQRVTNADSAWWEIIGIVGDQQQSTPGLAPEAEVFEYREHDWGRTVWFVIRTTDAPAAMTAAAQEVLAELDPLIPVAEVRVLRDVWRDSMAREEFLLTLLALFAVSALVLMTVGTYGVTAQAARQRTHEIGIRLALGARRVDVFQLILSQGLAVVGLGLVAGLAVALVGLRTMRALLFGIEPTDPLTLVGGATLLMLIAAAACFVPARRAAAANPTASLRVE